MASSPGALGSTVKQAEFKIGGKGTASVAEPFIFAGAGAGENRIKKILKRKDFNEFKCFYYDFDVDFRILSYSKKKCRIRLQDFANSHPETVLTQLPQKFRFFAHKLCIPK